jgi:type II secretory pathway component GspD/PulD (secretin)/tetratricopeptide (TPR) repeat protein
MKLGGTPLSIAACAALTALAVTDLYAGAPAPIPGGVPGGGAVPGGIPGGAAASPEQRDAIARLMEQERQRLAQQLQNNPIVAIQVEQAQKIAKAIEEIRVKAEELKFILRLELDRAKRAENIDLAAGHYETCLMHGFAFRRFGEGKLAGLLDDVKNPKRVAALGQLDVFMNQVYEGYVQNRIAMAEAWQQRQDYAKAKAVIAFAQQVLPDNLQLQAFARANERAEAEHLTKTPGGDVQARVEEIRDRDARIRVLLRDGKFLYDIKDYHEATDKFERALRLDPSNDIATEHLRLIGKIKQTQATNLREIEFRRRIQEVNDKWVEAPHQQDLPVPNPEWQRRTMKGSGGQAVSGSSNNGVFNKMQSIRLERVNPLHGFSLAEAVNLISLAAKEADTSTNIRAEKGINMTFDTRLPVKPNISILGGNLPRGSAPQVNPGSGLPELNRYANNSGSMADGFAQQDASGNSSGAAGQSQGLGSEGKVDPRHFDPASVKVTGLTTPLSNLTLGQVINAVVNACDQPIDYEVKDGIVVFKHRRTDQDYQMRTFSVKPNAFWQNLASRGGSYSNDAGLPLYEKQVNREVQTQDGQKWNISQPAYRGAAGGGGGGGGGVINNTDLGNQITQYFRDLGLNAAQVFINPSNGQLVRAPLADLDLIDQAIQILNSSPEQLYIEAKFAEIEFNDGESLGFDWYLGNSTMMGDKIIHGTGPQPTYIGSPSANNPSGYFPYPGTLVGNQFVPSQYSIQPSPNEGHLTSGFKGYGNPLWSFTGIMTDPQFRMVINTISQQEGAELLSAPRILAISGQQAQIEVVDTRNVVTGLQPTFIPGQGGGGFGGAGGAGGGTLSPNQNPEDFGPSLTVLPYVNSDGYTIEMSIVPTISEFLGYEDSTFEAAVFAAGGTVVRQGVPNPRIRTRTLNVNCVVWDQTVLAVGGLISENVLTTRDKVPYLGDLPFVGRVFRGKGRKTIKKNMVIYVKPTIIDPAGNHKNNPNQLPFVRTPSPDGAGFIPAPLPGAGAPLNKMEQLDVKNRFRFDRPGNEAPPLLTPKLPGAKGAGAPVPAAPAAPGGRRLDGFDDGIRNKVPTQPVRRSTGRVLARPRR